jgi:hypothetical protein
VWPYKSTCATRHTFSELVKENTDISVSALAKDYFGERESSSDIRAFEIKIKYFSRHVVERRLAHFHSHTSIFETSGGKGVTWPKEEFSEIVRMLQNELSPGFDDFHSHSSECFHFQNPLEIDICDDVLELYTEVTTVD